MRLSEFIRVNMEQILVEWENFARTILPDRLSVDELRDDADNILKAIAKDIETPQSPAEQKEKSRGGRARSAQNPQTASQAHVTARLTEGLDLFTLFLEYQALRASVIRLWTEHMEGADRSTLDELTRFNEAIDQALGEGIAAYTQKVDQSRELLLGVLGHDLRTPLGAMLLSARFLAGSGGSDEQNEKAATTILNSGARMQQLISGLLDFSSTRLGKRLPLVRAQVDLADICRHTIAEAQALYPDRDLVLDLSGDLAGAWDGARIGQMLSNLVGNALRHGSKSPAISLTARGEPDEVVLTVHNEGTPIPASELHVIFEPMYTTPKEKQEDKPSLGLGLYIARETARAHGGSINVASSKDQGTTFTVRLPRQ